MRFSSILTALLAIAIVASPARAQKQASKSSLTTAAPASQTSPPKSTTSALTPDYDHAEALCKQKRFKEAIPFFQSAYAKQQRMEDSSFSIGACYDLLGDNERALQYYKFVVEHWPDSKPAESARLLLTKSEQIKSMPKLWTNFQRGMQGHMLIPAQINGQRLSMMFDTGAAICFATTSQLERFGIKVNPTAAKARMLGVGGEAETKVALVELTVCGIKRQIPLFLQDDHIQASDEHHSLMQMENVPLLGESFFSDLAVEIDGPRQRLAMSAPKTKSDYDRNMTVPFRRENSLIMVTPKIMGRECTMILDTGAHALAFTDSQYAGLGFSRPINADAGGSVGVGGKRVGYSFFVNNVQLGPITKPSAAASMALHSNMPEPLLGESFLQDLHFTIEPVLKILAFHKD